MSTTVAEEGYDTKNIKATSVRKGDIVKGKLVDSVKKATKWTYMYDEAGKTIQEARNEETVSVHRKAATPRKSEAEQELSAEEMRTHANGSIEQKLDFRSTPLDQLKIKILDELESDGFLEAETIGSLIEAQADLRIMNEFSDLVASAPSGLDLVSLQKEFAQRLVDRLVHETQAAHPGSAIAHILDDCDKEAMARFIESARWYM